MYSADCLACGCRKQPGNPRCAAVCGISHGRVGCPGGGCSSPSATKVLLFLLSGSPLTCAPYKRSALRRLASPSSLPVNLELDLHHFKAGQQKTCAEISAVDTSIDDRRAPFDAEPLQAVRQVFISPLEGAHRSLQQHACQISPFLYCLGFRLFLAGLICQRNRPAWLAHGYVRLFMGSWILESILTQWLVPYLYTCL